MAATIKSLVQAALSAALATIYTAAASTIIKELIVCNTTTTVKTVRIHVVPPAGTATIANAIVYNLSVNPNETKVISLSTIMATGATIRASASAVNSVGVTISGVEIV